MVPGVFHGHNGRALFSRCIGLAIAALGMMRVAMGMIHDKVMA